MFSNLTGELIITTIKLLGRAKYMNCVVLIYTYNFIIERNQIIHSKVETKIFYLFII